MKLLHAAITFSTSILLFASYLPGQAPIITDDDVASVGNAFEITNANPLIPFDGTDTGPDHNWNFSDLVPILEDTSEWVDVSDTDPFYFFLWLTSDLAEQSVSDISTDYFTLEDVFNFYAKNSSTFEQTGFAGMITGIPLPISYDENDIIYEFPIHYEDSYESNSSFAIEVPGFGSWKEERHRVTTVDGWGEVSTPYGTFNALRIKAEIEITDTISYDAVVIPFTYTTTEYKWLDAGGGIPALQINVQNILGSETISQILYRGESVGTINPVENTLPDLTVSFTGSSLVLLLESLSYNDITAAVISADGRQIIRYENIQPGVNVFEPNNLASGFYLFIVQRGNTVLTTEPFIISSHGE